MKYIYFGISLIALSTLMLELLMIRVFDVILHKNMAYMVITCALLSFGLAGVYSTLKPLKENSDINRRLSLLSVLFGISALLILPAMNLLPFNLELFGQQPVTQAFSFLGMYIFLALPFFFSGLIFTTIFSVFSEKIQRLYFWDLAGAALGCLIIIPFLPRIGPGGLLFLVCSLCFLSGGLFIANKKAKVIIISIAVLIPIIPFTKEGYFLFTEHSDKRGVKIAREEGRVELTYWDPVSKIDVINEGNNKHVAYDGGSQSTNIYKFDGIFENLRKNLPHYVADHFWNRGVIASHYLKRDTDYKTLIIGSAGGQEVKAALTYGALEIDAVEMVAAVVDLGKGKYSDYNGGIFHHSNVMVYVAEGRRFLSGSDKKYDIIQIFSNHTTSSLASGSGALETNYLQTKEAYIKYFTHLKEGGILHINHHIYPRIITTAAAAWKELGKINFQKHVLVFERTVMVDNLPTILIKMDPWKASEVNEMKALFFADVKNGFEYVLAENPLNPSESFLSENFYNGDFPKKLSEIVPYRVEPPTDNEPFFNFLREDITRLKVNKEEFVNVSIAGLLNSQLTRRKNIPMDLIHLIVTGGISLFAAFAFTFIPLRISSVGKSENWKNRKESLIYFSCLGAGFIIIELIFMQIFMKLIGNPLYNFSTVLFVLLFAAGLGSMYSGKLNLNSGKRWIIPFAGIFITGLALLFIHQPLFEIFLSSSLYVRIFVAALLIFPLGFFLGMPFPLGILAISRQPKGAVAWAWGLNGLFTVVGGLLSVLFAILLGFKVTILAALLIYVVAFAVYSKMRRLAYS